MYVKSNINFRVRNDLMWTDVEAVWGEIRMGKHHFLISSMYRAPSQPARYYELMLDMLDQAASNNIDMVLMGDLNFNYDVTEDLHKNPVHYIEVLYGMKQLITDKTRVSGDSSSTIDVILTTFPNSHRKSGVCKVSLSDHYLIYSDIHFHSTDNEQHHNEIRYRDYKYFNTDDFIQDIVDDSIFNGNTENHDINWDVWREHFLKISDKHAPFKTIRVKNRHNPWITREVISLMYERDSTHQAYIQSGDHRQKSKYRILRNKVTSLIRENKYEYFKNLENEAKGNPRMFWSEIKRVLPKLNCKSIPKSLTSDEFNAYFTSIPLKISEELNSQTSGELPWKGQSSIYTFRFSCINDDNVLKLLRALPDKSGNDILGIDCKLLRIAAVHISHTLTTVLNQSINTGDVHNDWKKARVTPIYKNNGDLCDKNNYRPISVIGHIAKILEKLVLSQLLVYLTEHSFISPDQSAYLARHSTQTCLHRAVDDWLENINDDQITGAVLLDISKCFDVIDHDLLLKKLDRYGIRDVALRWFSSYLTKRTQSVICHGSLSMFLDVNMGVPQGSVLGPFLFLLFINDVTNFVTDGGVSNLFADDNFIYVSGKSVEEVKRRLQSILDVVADWYKRNRLKINSNKTKIMLIGSRHQLQALSLEDFHIAYEGNVLDVVTQAKYLGLHICSDLSWDVHIQHMCKQLSYYISMLRRLRAIFPDTVLLKIYKAHIQPRFDYGITVWGCTTEYNLNKVQRIQNMAARIITGNFDYINCRGVDLVKSLKLLTVRERRDYFLCLLTFKCIHGLAPHYLSDRIDMVFDVNGYNTRSTNNMDIYLPSIKKD